MNLILKLIGEAAEAELKNFGKERADSKYRADQLKLGRKVEREHTNSDEAADTIAKDHLDEDPGYYTKLKKMEQGD